VAFNSAKEICEKYKNEAGFESISSYFLLKKISQVEYDPVFALENICDPQVTYNSVRGQP